MTSISSHNFYADITLADNSTYALQIVDGSLTLDETRSPYVQADITIHTPAEDVSEKIDPRLNLRVTVTVLQHWEYPVRANQYRSFDLLLHERRFDHETGLTRIQLVSDEALLIDAGLVQTTPDTSAVNYQTSLRNIINNVVLSDFGAVLEYGTDDADFTVTEEAVNMFNNPRAATDMTSFVSGFGAATTRVATGGPTGSATFLRTAHSSGLGANGYIYQDVATDVRGLTMYVMSAWVRTSASGIQVNLQIHNRQDSTLLSQAAGPVFTLTPNVWTRIHVRWFSAASTNNFRAHIVNLNLVPSNATYDTTGWRLSLNTGTIGNVDTQYFDGATTSTYYTHSWLGTANASQSKRVPVKKRDPDALVWEPGVKAWDYLQPLIEAAGLRLFCNEAREWWLVDTNAYTVPGQINVAAAVNVTSATDTISRRAEYFDSVVVKYTWDDTEGISHTAYDSAGTFGGVTNLVEWDRPYPGPGAAQSILERAMGKGRTLDLEALSDYDATPGMSMVTTLPSTPIQTGVIASVTWNWAVEGSSHGLMRVSSRGLVDTPPNAWALAPTTRKWNTATGTWTTYINS